MPSVCKSSACVCHDCDEKGYHCHSAGVELIQYNETAEMCGYDDTKSAGSEGVWCILLKVQIGTRQVEGAPNTINMYGEKYVESLHGIIVAIVVCVRIMSDLIEEREIKRWTIVLWDQM